jgi:hypothetical protein
MQRAGRGSELQRLVTFPGDELHAAKLMFDIMEDQAPAELSLNDVDQLLALCKFSLADQLVAGFGAYILPVAQSLEPADVRPGIPVPFSCNSCTM